MPIIKVNELEIFYELHEVSPDKDTIVLINGLGGQLISWDEAFIDGLKGINLNVLVFDNRDVGLSTKIKGPVAKINPSMTLSERLSSQALYDLYDMAGDVKGLLDFLGIERAHVLGVSMGGMIAQCFAIKYTKTLKSLISIMSTTGNREVGKPTKEALQVLLTPPPVERQAVIEREVENAKIICSKKHPFDENKYRTKATLSFDRCFYPRGVENQLKAIIKTGDRTKELEQLNIKALIIHGKDDPLIHFSGGVASAQAIKGSSLVLIDNMGHEIPDEALPVVLKEISELVKET